MKRGKYSLVNLEGTPLTVLAYYCPSCKGEGCSFCDKIGYHTTESGAAILALVHDMIERIKSEGKTK